MPTPHKKSPSNSNCCVHCSQGHGVCVYCTSYKLSNRLPNAAATSTCRVLLPRPLSLLRVTASERGGLPSLPSSSSSTATLAARNSCFACSSELNPTDELSSVSAWRVESIYHVWSCLISRQDPGGRCRRSLSGSPFDGPGVDKGLDSLSNSSLRARVVFCDIPSPLVSVRESEWLAEL